MAEKTTIEQCLQEIAAIEEQHKQLDVRAAKLRERVQDALRKRIDRAMTSLIGTRWLKSSYTVNDESTHTMFGRIDAYNQCVQNGVRCVRITLTQYLSITSTMRNYSITSYPVQTQGTLVHIIGGKLPAFQDIINLWSDTKELNGIFSFSTIMRTDEDRELCQVIAAKARSVLANSEHPNRDWTRYVCVDILNRPDLVPSDLVVKQIKELPNGEN
mgnify:CR=1 FL=1